MSLSVQLWPRKKGSSSFRRAGPFAFVTQIKYALELYITKLGIKKKIYFFCIFFFFYVLPLKIICSKIKKKKPKSLKSKLLPLSYKTLKKAQSV